MPMKKTLLTRDGAEQLREELNRLRQEARPHAIEAIKDERDSPDFQESSAYAQALEHQQLIQRRIEELENKLANAEIIDTDAEHGERCVVFGALVTLRMEPEGEPVSYRIVGQDKADIPNGKLSVSAPLARALLGREAGEVVTVETPGGNRTCRILQVRYGE